LRRFAALWPDLDEKVQPLAAQIGWTHHQVLLDAVGENQDLYSWYVAKAAHSRWSRRYLKGQIDLRLHERLGAAVTNFASALEPIEAREAMAAVKDPYVFDFLELAEQDRERQLEQALVDDIQRFLLELGSVFAFYLNVVDEQLRLGHSPQDSRDIRPSRESRGQLWDERSMKSLPCVFAFSIVFWRSLACSPRCCWGRSPDAAAWLRQTPLLPKPA